MRYKTAFFVAVQRLYNSHLKLKKTQVSVSEQGPCKVSIQGVKKSYQNKRFINFLNIENLNFSKNLSSYLRN